MTVFFTHPTGQFVEICSFAFSRKQYQCSMLSKPCRSLRLSYPQNVSMKINAKKCVLKFKFRPKQSELKQQKLRRLSGGGKPGEFKRITKRENK